MNLIRVALGRLCSITQPPGSPTWVSLQKLQIALPNHFCVEIPLQSSPPACVRVRYHQRHLDQKETHRRASCEVQEEEEVSSAPVT